MKLFSGLFGHAASTSQALTRKFMQTTAPTGIERTFGQNEIIVSKTDLQGKITYGNDVFYRMADLTEAEALGAPHSIVRHPDMPRCVFKLAWDTIQSGNEIFAYVINLAKNGDHYWVLAHITPTFDASGAIIGYHSTRRSPHTSAVLAIKELYAQLRQIESAAATPKQGMADAQAALLETLDKQGQTYIEFIFSLQD